MAQDPSTVPYQPLVEPNSAENRSIDCNLLIEPNSRPPLKYHKALRALAITELVLAIVAVLAGFILFGTSISNRGVYDRRIPDVSGLGIDNQVSTAPPFDCDFTGVWLGIFYVIACSLGVGGLRKPAGYRCPITAYFVLLIICIVLTPILMGFSLTWAMAASSPYCNDGNIMNASAFCFISAINAILFIISFIQMILSIISTAFICYNWKCCGCCCCCAEDELQRSNLF